MKKNIRVTYRLDRKTDEYRKWITQRISAKAGREVTGSEVTRGFYEAMFRDRSFRLSVVNAISAILKG